MCFWSCPPSVTSVRKIHVTAGTGSLEILVVKQLFCRSRLYRRLCNTDGLGSRQKRGFGIHHPPATGPKLDTSGSGAGMCSTPPENHLQACTPAKELLILLSCWTTSSGGRGCSPHQPGTAVSSPSPASGDAYHTDRVQSWTHSPAELSHCPPSCQHPTLTLL